MKWSYDKNDEVRADGIRRLHIAGGSRAGGAAQRHKAKSRRTPQAGRAESEPSRAKAKEKTESRQAFRFLGPRLRVLTLVDGRFSHLAGDLGPSQTLADDLTNCKVKTVTVIHILAVVIAERLFIDVAGTGGTVPRSRRFRESHG